MDRTIIRPTPGDPREAKLSGNKCFCTGCGEYFNSVGAFDAHQRVNEPCIDPSTIGMEKNGAGFWRTPAPEGFDFTYMRPKTG